MKGPKFASDRFSRLRNFFAAWLNQDYHHNGDTLGEIVANYKNTQSQHENECTRQEISEFISESDSLEQDLAEALDIVFSPEVIVEGWDGMNTREFLLQIREWLA